MEIMPSSPPAVTAFTGADVDIIVPTFNRARYLPETLDSLLRQTLPGASILVVDDGSTDGTAEVVGRYDAQVAYVRKPNGGKAAALNVALARLSRRLVWIFDDDDIAVPDALARMVGTLNAHPSCGFVYGSYDKFEEVAGETLRQPVEAPSVSSEGLFVALMHRCFVLQCGLLVRRVCYDEVGFFNEDYARSQDYEMLLRLAQRFKGAEVPGVLFHQRQHSGARGTLTAPIVASRVEEAWRAFDRRIAGELRERLMLADYHPERERFDTDPNAQRVALLSKFVTFARKDRWDYAAPDLDAFLKAVVSSGSLQLRSDEVLLLRSVFDWYSRALHSFHEARAFRKLLRRSSHPALARAFCEALAQPLHYRLRLAIRRRARGELRDALRALAILRGQTYASGVLARTLLRAIAQKGLARGGPAPSELDIINGRV